MTGGGEVEVDEDEDEDEDGEVGEDDDDVEDEHEHASTRTATEESSSNGSSSDKDNKHEAKEYANYDWGYWEDNAVDKTKFDGVVVEDDDGEEDASTQTATDESSSNGSSVDKDSKHEAKENAGYDWGDWEDNAAEETKFEGPSYSLKIRVWPSCGYANILIFDGICWMSTQDYTLSMLSSTEAQIMVKKLADVSEFDMEVDNSLLASNAMLLRIEYEGLMVKSEAVEIFVLNISPSLYHFDVHAILGKGSFCNVRLCTGGDEKDYAIKIIRSEEDPNEPREVAILSSLKHAHVVQFVQAWTESEIFVSYEECSSSDMSPQSDDSSQDDEYRESGEAQKHIRRSRYILILMELCEGNLRDYLSSESRELDDEKSLQIFKEIVKGLQYVHGENIIHRDLKPSNIFLGKDGKFKLGDFGQSRLQPTYTVSFKATPNLGTIFYAAPELAEGKRISDKVDIYPLGVIYFELYHISEAMFGKSKKFDELKDADGSNIVWEGNFCLFKQMVASDPIKRPSVNDVLELISQVRFPLQKKTEESKGLHQFGQSEEVNVAENQDSTPAEESDTPRGETRA